MFGIEEVGSRTIFNEEYKGLQDGLISWLAPAFDEKFVRVVYNNGVPVKIGLREGLSLFDVASITFGYKRIVPRKKK